MFDRSKDALWHSANTRWQACQARAQPTHVLLHRHSHPIPAFLFVGRDLSKGKPYVYLSSRFGVEMDTKYRLPFAH